MIQEDLVKGQIYTCPVGVFIFSHMEGETACFEGKGHESMQDYDERSGLVRVDIVTVLMRMKPFHAVDILEKKQMVKIEIDAYNAVKVLSFCREFVNDNLPNKYMFQALKDAVDEFERVVALQLTDEQWTYIKACDEVNGLIGKVPDDNAGHGR